MADRLRRLIGAAILSCGIAAWIEQSAIGAAATDTYTVTIENMQFHPAELTVKRGSRIVWINKDLFPHTATALAKAFDSSSIAADASWSYTASQPGDHPYICALHPTMKGRLIVQ